VGKLTPKNIVQLCKNKCVLLLTHEHADLDSFASASMMQIFLSEQKIDSIIGVPSHINEQAKKFADFFRISYVLNPILKDFEIVLIFDFNSFEQLGPLKKNFVELYNKKDFEVVVFDHHVLKKTCIGFGGRCVLDENMVSTTQLIYNFLDTFSNPNFFFFNCIGILEDTGHFLVGSDKCFLDFSVSLKKSKRVYVDVLFFTKTEFDNSQRIALLKAAQRSNITQIKDFVLITSKVSFYQSFVATRLLNFGAHIALVAGCDRSGVCTLSARADSVFKEKNNFNLVSDLLLLVKDKLGGEVGGHSGAAQWKGKSSPEEVLRVSNNILKKRFK
jgi:nanoRNase/pAp phosphatase (c-di-AMP/oligoRNAs hydrolase)